VRQTYAIFKQWLINVAQLILKEGQAVNKIIAFFISKVLELLMDVYKHMALLNILPLLALPEVALLISISCKQVQTSKYDTLRTNAMNVLQNYGNT
jgi:hypothetical protein